MFGARCRFAPLLIGLFQATTNFGSWIVVLARLNSPLKSSKTRLSSERATSFPAGLPWPLGGRDFASLVMFSWPCALVAGFDQPVRRAEPV